MAHGPPIRIAPDQLEAATLRSVLEEFVTRDGTELSDLDSKIAAVRALLESGGADIWFDPETGTCNIVAT